MTDSIHADFDNSIKKLIDRQQNGDESDKAFVKAFYPNARQFKRNATCYGEASYSITDDDSFIGEGCDAWDAWANARTRIIDDYHNNKKFKRTFTALVQEVLPSDLLRKGDL